MQIRAGEAYRQAVSEQPELDAVNRRLATRLELSGKLAELIDLACRHSVSPSVSCPDLTEELNQIAAECRDAARREETDYRDAGFDVPRSLVDFNRVLLAIGADWGNISQDATVLDHVAAWAMRERAKSRVVGQMRHPSTPDNEPSGHCCTDRTPGPKPVASIKLNRWGIGHNGSDWILFNLDRNGGKPRWETRGKIDIPSGRCERIARHLLQQAQRDNGRAAVDQKEVVELFRADYAGRTDEKIRASVVTPAMNKLRQAIRGSLERVCKATVTADPIPWDKTARIWDSPLTFGIVEEDDDGNVTLCVEPEV
jgi:hypothetical protein